MATLRLIGFIGEIPKTMSRLLPDNAAEEAFNTRLEDGGLKPIRQPRYEHYFSDAPADAYRTLYRHNDEWLAWEQDVYAVPGPIAADRLYIFGDGVPKMRVDDVNYDLAVNAPPTALTGTVSGTATSDLNATRLYAYTNVTQFGEESQPSPISNEINWYPGQTVTLTGFNTTMGNNRTATTQRIYRAQSTTTGVYLFFIAERTASTSNFVDTVPLENFNEQLPTTSLTPPPDDLTGVISMPNGMMAGFVGKDVYFCEPYLPHAWPVRYSMTVDYEVVGLAAYGNTLVVMTTGNPYLMSGSGPANMTSEKLELNLPCINARGIQDMGYGVIYPTHDGLVAVQSGSASVISDQLLARTDWDKFRPATMVSGQFNGRYFSSYDYVAEDKERHTGSLIFDTSGSQAFITRTDITAQAFFYDMVAGRLFYLEGQIVYEWDAPEMPNNMLFYRTKEFVLPRPTNFGAILIEADTELTDDEYRAILAQQEAIALENQAIIDSDLLGGAINDTAYNTYPVNGDALKPYPSFARTLSVTIYADNKPVATVDRVGKMARLPSGFMARRWKVSVFSDVPLAQIALAGTGVELMGV